MKNIIMTKNGNNKYHTDIMGRVSQLIKLTESKLLENNLRFPAEYEGLTWEKKKDKFSIYLGNTMLNNTSFETRAANIDKLSGLIEAIKKEANKKTSLVTEEKLTTLEDAIRDL